MTEALDGIDVKQEILSIKDWRHPFEIEPGVWVDLLFDWFKDWHEWRVHVLMPNIEKLVEICVPGGMRNASVLDVGCWDGFYGFEFIKRGARYLKGIDLREENLRQAKLLKRHFGYENCDFELANIQDKQFDEETYDVVIFNGILYHLSAPIDVLKAVGDATRAVVIASTYVTRDPEPDLRLKWDNPSKLSMGHQELVTIPSQSALVEMLKWAGFNTVLRDIPYPFHERYAGSGFGFYYGLKGINATTLERVISELDVRQDYDPELPLSQIVRLEPDVKSKPDAESFSLRKRIAARLHRAIDKVL